MFPEGRKVLGVERAKISYEIAPDQSHWGVEIAGKIKAWAKSFDNEPGMYDGFNLNKTEKERITGRKG